MVRDKSVTSPLYTRPPTLSTRHMRNTPVQNCLRPRGTHEAYLKTTGKNSEKQISQVRMFEGPCRRPLGRPHGGGGDWGPGVKSHDVTPREASSG